MKPRKQLEKPCGAGARQGLPEPPQIVALYIRVSTAHQVEGDSLEEQESELKKYCDYRGFRIHTILVEAGKSGGNTNRPEYQKLIKLIQQQKITAVIVKKLDRLSRSLLDFEQLMIMLQSNNVEFISLKESFDTTTAMGKAMLRIALVFAQLEREQTAERISDVMDYRARLGMYNGGRAPFGYLSTNKELIVSNAQKPIVEHIFKLFVESHSTAAVAHYLNDAKLFPPSKKLWKDTSIECILKNPTYKGMVVWKKEAHPGAHPPIIAASLWDTVQAIFSAQKRLSPPTKSDSLLQKLVICGHCKTPLTPSFAYNRSKTKYLYYRCGSTIHGHNHHEKIQCTFKYIAFHKMNLALQNAIQKLVEPHVMSELDSKTFSHNQALTLSIKTLSDHIQLYEEESKAAKAKKNEYIDALVIKQFSVQDHKKIHERIQELDSELKKQHAQITRNRLEITQFENQIISIETLKETLLKLHDTPQTNPDYRPTLQSIIKQIEVSIHTLIFHFKILPWTVEVTLNTS